MPVKVTMYVTFKEHRAGKSIQDNPSLCTTIEVPTKEKWLPSDIVAADGTVQKRNISAHRNIVGIVDFLNRTRCGFTSRNIPLYYFHPLDTAYPTMVVAAKLPSSANQLAIASFEHWDEKWPRAGIHTFLGAVGDKHAEKAALYAKFIVPKRVAFAEVCMPDLSVITPYDAVINIDPPGCEDVDDVFCWKRLEDGYEFAIAIADVAAWVPEDTDIDRLAHQKGETVYVDGAVVEPMLPVELSTLRASLRADGVPRPVVALVYTIRNDKVVATEWKSMNIVISQYYTYETIYENLEGCCVIRDCLYTIGDKKPLSNDSHEWVERAMITYNANAAKLLRNNNVGLLRQHTGIGGTEWSTLAEKTGCKELAFLGMSKGAYVYASTDNPSHNGLGLLLYCHASSPLRRYADLINQRFIKYILTGKQKPTQPVYPSHLNARSRAIKSLERDLWFLANLNTDTLTEQRGFLIAYKPERNIWSVYVPAWKRTIKAKYNGAEELMSGMSVPIQTYTNLSSVSWRDRVVCNILL